MTRMKRNFCLALCVVALVGCTHIKREKELTAKNDSLTVALDEKNAALEEAMKSIADVQEGFRAINEAEGRVAVNSQGIEGTTESQHLREDIQFIQQKMADNRRLIEELQRKLDVSDKSTANLRKVLENLKQELNEKVASITTLRAELAQKNIRIAELDSAVVMLTGDVNALQKITELQQEQIAQQTAEINTAWYVYGTAKELKEQNILNRGEVLTSTEFNKSYFTEIDIREDKVFPLYAKRAKLLTTHPVGSYEFTKDELKQLTLHVIDTEAFWSVSRYMVIQVR